MKLSQRETMLAIVTAGAVLFGLSYFPAKSRINTWKEFLKRQAEVSEQIRRDREMIGQRARWQKEFVELSKMLPQHPPGSNVDVYWLSVMDRVAAKHSLQIFKRKAGEEKKMGDVYELSIDCQEWEGNYEAITHFLFDLQSEGGMFDIRQLVIKPQDKGPLKGRFLLECAYTREGGGSGDGRGKK